jgi:hypothetical protein
MVRLCWPIGSPTMPPVVCMYNLYIMRDTCKPLLATSAGDFYLHWWFLIVAASITLGQHYSCWVTRVL